MNPILSQTVDAELSAAISELVSSGGIIGLAALGIFLAYQTFKAVKSFMRTGFFTEKKDPYHYHMYDTEVHEGRMSREQYDRHERNYETYVRNKNISDRKDRVKAMSKNRPSLP